MLEAELESAALKPPGPRPLLAVLAGLFVALLAEISINPFGTAFRFSLGPIALSFFSLFFPMLPAYLSGLAAGIAVPITHTVFAWARQPHASMAELLPVAQSYVPETLAYSILGAALYIFRVHERTRAPIQVMALVAVADCLTNVVELFIRTEPVTLHALVLMGLVAVGRAAVSAGVFYVLQEGVRERQWALERRRYMEKLLWVTNLQTETFFLRKSSGEIEQIMAKAHKLYRHLAGHSGEPAALEIAKDIHEVKKDHQRTLSSLMRLVEMPPLKPEMAFSEIVELVVETNGTYAATAGKQMLFDVHLGTDFRTPRFGRWITILNNLVTNGVEACSLQGSITVRAEHTGEFLQVRVRDTGSGIAGEDWELIFSPGFSTKPDPVTGAFSSGIGLTHVAGLVKSMGGTIRVERSDPGGTTFLVSVPWESLEAV